MRITTFLLVAASTTVSFGGEGLPEDVRRRIDERALGVPVEPVRESTKRGAAGMIAWLADRAPLDERDEGNRLDTLHRGITGEFEVLPLPARVDRVWERIRDAVPRDLHPGGEPFALVVLDADDARAFGRGGRRVYVTRGLLTQHAGSTDARLAFVLARQIGHTVLGHSERDARITRLGDVAAGDARTTAGAIAGVTTATGLNAWLPTAARPNDDRDADLFALHLCRNAGFDLECALDELRAPLVGTAADDAEAIRQLRRIARLRRELDGTFDSERFGLFRHDPERETWVRAEDRSVSGSVVVFVHGMESGTAVWEALHASLSEHRPEGTTFLAFVHPNDGSLWAAGRGLKREIGRVVREPERIDFVAHSAGGLVTRVYTDLEGGAFRRAVLLGTPHHGSNLANLRLWIEATRFAGNLRLGYPAALRETLIDGEGQMTIDLRPGSLFLVHLRDAEVPMDVRRRFTNVRGRRWGRAATIGMRTSWFAARKLLRRRLATTEARPVLRDLAIVELDGLTLPPEITAGDLAVSLKSAHLAGAREFDFPLDHMALVRDPTVFPVVRDGIATDAPADE